jgi:Domain of unknown function (DUF4395)
VVARGSWWRALCSFPDPVNEIAARTVATGVVVMAAAALVFEAPWMLVVLTYGFWARVLTGPTLSPLGQLAHAGRRPPFAGRPPAHTRSTQAVRPVNGGGAVHHGHDRLGDPRMGGRRR